MSITLYPHQNEFVSKNREALRSYQAVLAQASCGFGKTVTAAYIARSAVSKRKRILFTVHRKDLLRQTALTFDNFRIPYGYIAADYKPNPFAPVQIASMQTLRKRLHTAGHFDLVIPDEAHLSAAKGQKKILLYYKKRGSKLMGLTATPSRLSGEGLNDIFDTMVQGPSMAWLIKEGFLSDYKIYAPASPDLHNVHTRMGDYVHSELEAAMNTNIITGNAISHYKKLAWGKRTLAFCVSIKHSQQVAAQFIAAGVMAVHIDGETKQEDRIKAFRAFAKGDIQVITSVAIFCEGFDLSAQVGKEVPVEAGIILRPTQSLTLYMQICGRFLRRKLQPAIILDHAGCVLRHGLPDDEREWSLEGNAGRKGKKQDGSEVPVRQCPQCYFVHRPMPRCPGCGYIYEVVGRIPDQVEGDLVELDKATMKRRRMHEQSKARTLDELVALGTRRGYKHPYSWAARVWTSREAKRRA